MSTSTTANAEPAEITQGATMTMPQSSMQGRKVRIVAQDPSVRRANGRVLTAEITLPWEHLIAGPMSYAIYVLDYDATSRVMYRPAAPPDGEVPAPLSRADLLADPEYHAQNVYAVVARTLQRFESALGRRVGWGIRGHQLKIVPHAFEEANAYYSPELEALVFGYVRGNDPMFLCLSHDVIVHETAHALLDGLRDKFREPSSADQAALHEAFADIVALLSVYALPEVVTHLLTPLHRGPGGEHGAHDPAADHAVPAGFIPKSALSEPNLERTALFGLADQMRGGTTGGRVNALRRSVAIPPSPKILDQAEYREEHRRGEVLVAAVLRAFLKAWVARIDRLGVGEHGPVSLLAAAEAGSDIADTMLTMAIRAIDYTPPIHIGFDEYLSAMLTADDEVRPDDSRYRIRRHLRQACADYGIRPASKGRDGLWIRPTKPLLHSGSHLSRLQTDPTEMFRFLFVNHEALRLNPEAYTRVASVRPCFRVTPDGAHLQETVVECTQYLKLAPDELAAYGLVKPDGIADDQQIVLEGGSTLVLGEYGDLKFEISNRVLAKDPPKSEALRWQRRLDYMAERGYLMRGRNRSSQLDALHLQRTLADNGDSDAEKLTMTQRNDKEAWR